MNADTDTKAMKPLKIPPSPYVANRQALAKARGCDDLVCVVAGGPVARA